MLTDYHLHLRPTRSTRRAERVLHRRRTSSATSRRRARPGSRSSASPSTSTASPTRSRSGTTRSGARTRATTSPPTASSCARRRCGSGSRWTSSPGARTGSPTLLDAHDFDYVVGSVHFVGDGAVDRRRLRRLGARSATPTASGAATSRRSPRRRARASSTSSPTPTWSRSGATARPLPERDPRFYYEPAIEAIAETGIAVEVSTAGLRKPVGELYPAAGVRRDVRRRRRRLRALLRRPRARARRLRVRARGRDDARAGASSEIASSSAASAAWSRSDERIGIGYDSHRFAAGPPAGPRRGRDRARRAGSRATPTPTSLTHAVIDALLGAAGLGDLGTHFPPDDERWRDADSLDLLRTVVGDARRARSPTSTRP